MIKKSDLKLRLFTILFLAVLSLFYVFPLQEKINLGLDLQGGMHVLLDADLSGIPSEEASNAMDASVATLRRRIDAFGVREPSITIQGRQSILVQVPGLVDRQIVDNLREVGRLEFKLVSDDEGKKEKALEGEIPEGYQLKEYEGQKYLLESQVALTGADLSRSYVSYGEQRGLPLPEVGLRFTSEGSRKFAEVTRQNVGRQLAIILDGQITGAPQIREAIVGGRAQITGNFTVDEARATVAVLNSGALPVPLHVAEERSVGPILGFDSIQRGIQSIALGALLVAGFVLIYYLLGGIVTIICLILDLLFILVGLRLFGATLTLPGIAGMILTLGMAVDANVLILERIREELRQGKPISIAIRNGFDKAKRTIFDANLTTLIAAIFLFIYGTGPIRGFAITLSLGILSSIFTAVFVGRMIYAFVLELRLKRFPMFSLVPRSHIDFIKLKNVCLIISLFLVLAGLINFHRKGEDAYGIDFVGGQNLEYKITPEVDVSEIRALLAAEGFVDINIQEFQDIEGAIAIESKEDIAGPVFEILDREFDSVDELRVATIGPRVGGVLRRRAISAIILSLLGILLFVAYRFKHFDFAFAAIIALFHDVLFSLGVMIFAGHQLSLLTVTALLTIAGYSINDTIVIYDRIREILPRMQKANLSEVINTAINETISRTAITSLTTLLVVLSIFLLGGRALAGFSFTLLVGIVVGTYSSVFIASPLVLFFRKSRLLHKS